MKKKRTGRVIIGRIFKVLLLVLIVAAVVFHRPIYVLVRSYVGESILDKGSDGLEYVPQSLTKEQMIEDFDSMYQYVCATSKVTEQAERYLKVDYDDLYEKYRARIENCKDEYEFFSIMESFMAKLPGAHNVMYAPSDDMRSADSFPVGWEMGFHDIRQVNYAYWTQFEDRMNSYTQKSAVASRRGTDYVIIDHDFGNGQIEGITGGRILTLNGKTIAEQLMDIDTIHHITYDAENDCARVTQIIFNDSIGEKYEAEIEMPDGTIVKKDLYISPEFSASMQFKDSTYGDEKDNRETPEDENEEISYTIETDKERKLVYAYVPKCQYFETEGIRSELTDAIETARADNIIIDLRNNGGGNSSFATEGVCSAVLDKDVEYKSTACYPNNEIVNLFCDNILYRIIMDVHKEKDTIEAATKYSVKGVAKKHLNIYVLVSGRTFSSGDICAGILATQDNVTIIGENTQGEGFTGSPLVNHLPNSKFVYAYSSASSKETLDNNYLGTVPDIYSVCGFKENAKQNEMMAEGLDPDSVGKYKNRQKWDTTLNKALELIDNKGKEKQQK